MMLSNSDDPWIVRSSSQDILDTASAQGRFWLIPINFLAGLPYLSGNWAIANSLKIATNSAVFVFFVLFCCRLLGRSAGLLVGMVWLALIDVSPGYYSPFHGFLFMFNLQFATLFASLLWYLHILDSPNPDRLVVGPYLLFGFSLLAYEPMLFYAGVFPVLYVARWKGPQPALRSIGTWFRLALGFAKNNWMLGAAVVAYIATYFLYRKFQPNPGRGLDAGGNPIDIALTIYRFSIHGFHFQPKAFGNFIDGVSALHNWWLALIFALSVAAAALLTLPRRELEKVGQQLSRPLPLLVLVFYLFSPNLLHGFVEMYRKWAADDPHYVGNYISSFPLAILVTVGLIQLTGGRKAMQEKVLLLIVVALLASSACDNYVRWSNLAEINRKDAKLWRDAISELKEDDRIKAAAPRVCGINAPEKVSGDDRYWSSVLSELLNNKIEYHSKSVDAYQCTVRIDFNRYRFKS